jgi:hypothetical protein
MTHPTHPAGQSDPPRQVRTEPDQQVTSRVTTDGTQYRPDTYETTDGSQTIPYPMVDPQTGTRNRLPQEYPIGDPRLEHTRAR